MTKQVFSYVWATTCSALMDGQFSKFFKHKQKAETSWAAETVEKDHDALCFLYVFMSCQYSETSHVLTTVS